MHIEQIDCDAFKENIVRTILEALPEWFGIPQAIEEYAVNSCGKPFFCAFDCGKAVGSMEPMPDLHYVC